MSIPKLCRAVRRRLQKVVKKSQDANYVRRANAILLLNEDYSVSDTRLSPRRSRSTTSCLRFADQRFTDFSLMDTSCRSHSTTKCVSSLFGRQPRSGLFKSATNKNGMLLS